AEALHRGRLAEALEGGAGGAAEDLGEVVAEDLLVRVEGPQHVELGLEPAEALADVGGEVAHGDAVLSGRPAGRACVFVLFLAPPDGTGRPLHSRGRPRVPQRHPRASCARAVTGRASCAARGELAVALDVADLVQAHRGARLRVAEGPEHGLV